MDNYKLAFIYGKTAVKKKMLEGDIEKYGEMSDDAFHINCLLDFIKEKEFENPVFSKLNKKHPPELVSYLISNMGHVVFLNTSKSVKKYGKTGIFMIPSNISLKALESLYLFADSIKDYYVTICYEMNLVDGIVIGKELQNSDINTSPRKILEEYFSNIENNVSKKQ